MDTKVIRQDEDAVTIKTSLSQTLRIGFLWNCLPAYAQVCLSALDSALGADLWYASIGTPPGVDPDRASDLPFAIFSGNGNPRETASAALRELNRFGPDVLIATGWSIPAVREVARTMKSQGVRTVCMADTPWVGTLRQTMRCVAGRQLLHRCYDAMWIPGARAIPLAQLSGFSGRRLWQNLYCGNTALFSKSTAERLQETAMSRRWPRRLLFVGRLASSKNVEGLATAYKLYRDRVADPWTLTCVGEGSLRSCLEAGKGVECVGWRTPLEIAALMGESGCLVLPSLFDPWGVVAHEAACAGLPLLLGWNVGSGDELLRDGYNGRKFDPYDVSGIAAAMRWITEHPEPWTLGARSYELSRQFSPELWAQYVLEKATELSAGGTG